MTDNENDSFLYYYFLALVITCILIGYLLYWLIKKSKTDKFTRLKFKKKITKSIKVKRKKDGQKNKSSDDLKRDSHRTVEKTKSSSSEKKKTSPNLNDQLQQKEKQLQQQPKELVSIKIEQQSDTEFEKLQKDHDIVLKQFEKMIKAKPEPDDYNLNIRGSKILTNTNLQIKSNAILQPSSSSKLDNRKSTIPFKKQKSQLEKKNKIQKSIVLLEPNKVLKEAMKSSNEFKSLLMSSSSKMNQKSNNKSSLYPSHKVDSSVTAYQTTPISIEGNNEHYTSNTLSKAEDSINKTSTLSLSGQSKKSHKSTLINEDDSMSSGG